MNERIFKLAEQAEWSVRWGNPNNYEEYNRALDEWQEKFAELIVRECAGIDFRHKVGMTADQEFDTGRVILEHFGVEE